MAMPSARGKPLKHAQAAKTCSRSVRSTESSLALPQSTASALRMSLSHTSERAASCLWRKGGRPGALHAEYTPRARQRVRCYFQAHAPPPITSSSGPPRPNRPHTATPRRGLRDAHTGCVRTARGRRGRRASGRTATTLRCAVQISPETWFPPLLASLAPHLRGGVGPTAVPMGYEGTLAPPDGVTALDCVSCAATRAEVRFSPKS